MRAFSVSNISLFGLLALAALPTYSLPIASSRSREYGDCSSPKSCRMSHHGQSLPSTSLLNIVNLWGKTSPAASPRVPHFPEHQLIRDTSDVLVHPIVEPVIPTEKAGKKQRARPKSDRRPCNSVTSSKSDKVASVHYGYAIPEASGDKIHEPPMAALQYGGLAPGAPKGMSSGHGVVVFLLFIVVIMVAETSTRVISTYRRAVQVARVEEVRLDNEKKVMLSGFATEAADEKHCTIILVEESHDKN